MSQAIQDIVDFTDEKLAGSGLKFALVLWKHGAPIGMNDIGLVVPGNDLGIAEPALALAAQKAGETPS